MATEIYEKVAVCNWINRKTGEKYPVPRIYETKDGGHVVRFKAAEEYVEFKTGEIRRATYKFVAYGEVAESIIRAKLRPGSSLMISGHTIFDDLPFEEASHNDCRCCQIDYFRFTDNFTRKSKSDAAERNIPLPFPEEMEKKELKPVITIEEDDPFLVMAAKSTGGIKL